MTLVMSEKAMTDWRGEARNTIRKMDANVEPKSDTYLAAMILLASMKVGPVQYKIATLLGVHQSKIRPFIRRLRSNGVFSRGNIYCDWCNEESGGIAFWCDVATAEGLLARAN